MQKLLWALVALIGFALWLGGTQEDVRASGSYGSGVWGYDISYPQCTTSYPAPPFAFGIVGVTRGRAFTQNPCLQSEYAWASQASATAPTFYMNVNYPIGSTAVNGMSGPRGDCSKNDKACQAYNYGYNTAQDAHAYAASLGLSASMWWLDIETTNSWSPKPALNAEVIQGALDFFIDNNLSVGAYSTKSQWTKIAGSYVPVNLPQQLPNWVAGATSATAPSFCSPSYAFGGGSVWLVQFVSNNFDNNYAC